MSGLKDLRRRIKTVHSTQKITKAMKLVAASKLRKAADSATKSIPYFENLLKILSHVSANYKEVKDNRFLSHKSEAERRKYLIVVLSADRGLCGAFNSSLVRMAIKRIKDLENIGHEVKVICVGKKAVSLMQNSYYAKLVIKEFVDIKQNDTSFAEELKDCLISSVCDDEFDRCEFIYNKYISALVQRPENMQIIPFPVEKMSSKFDIKPYDGELIYEPKLEKFLDILMPKAILGLVRHFLLENYASEQAARMTAMDNSSKNASDMMEKLTLLLNRSRQALITRELMEIISGAEAV